MSLHKDSVLRDLVRSVVGKMPTWVPRGEGGRIEIQLSHIETFIVEDALAFPGSDDAAHTV